MSLLDAFFNPHICCLKCSFSIVFFSFKTDFLFRNWPFCIFIVFLPVSVCQGAGRAPSAHLWQFGFLVFVFSSAKVKVSRIFSGQCLRFCNVCIQELFSRFLLKITDFTNQPKIGNKYPCCFDIFCHPVMGHLSQRI